jgi:hypothetical protein
VPITQVSATKGYNGLERKNVVLSLTEGSRYFLPAPLARTESKLGMAKHSQNMKRWSYRGSPKFSVLHPILRRGSLILGSPQLRWVTANVSGVPAIPAAQ